MTIRNAMTTELASAIRQTITYCYSYQRISSRKQMKGGGINRQLEASTAICQEKGWTLDNSFRLTDIGKSAYHGRHLDDKAALGGFLNAVDKGLVKRPAVLLVESLDRLSRENIMDALELFIRILNTGITIYTSIDRITYNREDIKSNFGPLIISITILCRAHEESLIKAERIKKSWKDKRKKIADGMIGPKRIYPEWIDISTGKPVVIEEKADQIREVFYLCINKNMSYAAIIKHMSEKYGESSVKSPPSLKRLFTKKRVLGLYEPNEINSDNKKQSLHIEIPAYPSIISEDTFYAAQAAVKSRINIGSGRPSKKPTNYFRSCLRCGCCDSSMVLNGTGRGASSYRCKRRMAYGKECGQRAALSAMPFQPVLLQALAVIDKDDMLASASSSKKAKLLKELATKHAELDDKQTRMDNLAELVAAGSNKGIQMVVELERDIGFISQGAVEIQDQLDMLNSPTMAASINHINAFHQRFQLGKATKKDQIPFIEALKNTVEKIVIHSPEEEGQRTIVVMHLQSGIKIRIVVFKDYSADVYKGKKRLIRIEARKK